MSARLLLSLVETHLSVSTSTVIACHMGLVRIVFTSVLQCTFLVGIHGQIIARDDTAGQQLMNISIV
jgi:hypothetical protein